MDKQQIPAGYKQTEVGVIPEDWSIDILLNVCEKITDGTHDTPKPTMLGEPFLTAIHVKENRIDFESCYYLPKNIHDEIYSRCNPQRNDVLMVNIGAGVATSALVNVDYEFSLKNVALLKTRKQKLIGQYLNFYQSYVKNKVYESLATGGAQPFLSLTQIGQLKISLPRDIKEQTAIANALSDVDALIAALEKLINKKTAIKTATMQQLLTGKKRLPPFDQLDAGYKQTELGEIPKDWKYLSIVDVFQFKQGVQTPVENQKLIASSGYVKFIRIIDLTNPAEHPRYILDPGANYHLGEADLFMVRYGNPGLVGFRMAGVIANNLFRLIPKLGLSTEFYFHYLKYIHNDILELSGSSTMPAISFSTLSTLQLIVPLRAEQTAIANVLSDMDTELDALQQRLAKTQHIKQGMMQELLTGKTRLI